MPPDVRSTGLTRPECHANAGWAQLSQTLCRGLHLWLTAPWNLSLRVIGHEWRSTPIGGALRLQAACAVEAGRKFFPKKRCLRYSRRIHYLTPKQFRPRSPPHCSLTYRILSLLPCR